MNLGHNEDNITKVQFWSMHVVTELSDILFWVALNQKSRAEKILQTPPQQLD